MIDDSLDRVLPLVQMPSRYTDGEWNARHKPHDQVALKVALAYPDTYEVGMSHLGLRILYDILNARPDALAERVFSPWTDLEAQMRQAGLPLWALESGRPVREFDLFGISLPYEMTFTNALNLLDLAGLPLASAERSDEHPLVIAGGPGAANPEPLAEFVDAFVLGEGEEVIVEIAEAMLTARGKGREATLKALAAIPGVYVPSLYEVAYDGPRVASVTPRDGAPAMVCRRVIEDFDSAPYPVEQVVPFLETVHDRVTLEIMRGCSRGCRFCQAGMVYRPARERSVEHLAQLAGCAVRATGWDEIALLAFNAPDHSQIEALIDRLLAEHAPGGVNISLPSSRTDTFSVALANRLSTVRRGGLTFAPEAGTPRLRHAINKPVNQEHLLAAAGAAFEAGWNRIKLYFMIGLPTETDEDVDAIADLIAQVHARGREILGSERRGRLRIGVSVAAFVPKPHTPFQWWGQVEGDALRARQLRLRERTHLRGVGMEFTSADPAWVEAALSRGDRRVGTAIRRAWELGCRFDAWDDRFNAARWRQAFAECGLDAAFYANRRIPADEPLPWDHLSYGVTREFLQREAEAALRGELTDDCRTGPCTVCGACDRAGEA